MEDAALRSGAGLLDRAREAANFGETEYVRDLQQDEHELRRADNIIACRQRIDSAGNHCHLPLAQRGVACLRFGRIHPRLLELRAFVGSGHVRATAAGAE